MAEQWVTISYGMPGAILAQRAALEANGIPTFVPDETMKSWEPFMTGANSLDSLLQVPASQVEHARGVLEDAKVEVPPPGPAEQANRLAARMAFASMLLVTSPVTLFVAPRYFRLVRQAGERPRNHWMAWFAVGLATFALGVAMLAYLLRGWVLIW